MLFSPFLGHGEGIKAQAGVPVSEPIGNSVLLMQEESCLAFVVCMHLPTERVLGNRVGSGHGGLHLSASCLSSQQRSCVGLEVHRGWGLGCWPEPLGPEGRGILLPSSLKHQKNGLQSTIPGDRILRPGGRICPRPRPQAWVALRCPAHQHLPVKELTISRLQQRALKS